MNHHIDPQKEYAEVAGQAFVTKAREAEGEFIRNLPPLINAVHHGAIDLLRADCDRLTEENERLKAQLEHQTRRTQHYVDQNMGLINAVAVLGNRISS